jgi:HEPN domain-containing protein
MQPEQARLHDVQSWLSKVELDLRAATHEMTAPEEELWGDVVFHAQQAAEKAMKTFLAWHDAPFRKTQNLEELGMQCARLDESLKSISEQAAPLTAYAWRFRYPGDSGSS